MPDQRADPLRARIALLPSHKGFKDALLQVGRYTDPGILDPDVQVIGRRLHAEARRRVRGEIERHLVRRARRDAADGAGPAQLDRPVMVAAHHALERCVAAAQLVRGRALVVNSVDDEAAAFWRRRGFLPSKDDPMVLFRSIADIAASLLEAARRRQG